MSNLHFELNESGVRELLKSQQMQKGLEGIASSALHGLGAGYSMNTYQGKNRLNVEIVAETYEARKENAENNTILKAVQS